MSTAALTASPATEVRDTVPIVREYLEMLHGRDDDSDAARDLQETIVQVAFECRRSLGVPRPTTLGWSVHEWTAAALYLMRVQAADLFDRDVFITYCGEPDGPMPGDLRAIELDAALNDRIDSICAQIVGLR